MECGARFGPDPITAGVWQGAGPWPLADPGTTCRTVVRWPSPGPVRRAGSPSSACSRERLRVRACPWHSALCGSPGPTGAHFGRPGHHGGCGDRCHQRRIARSAILGWNETGGPCPSRRVSIWFGAVRKKACRVAARRARAPVAQGWGWDRTGKVEGRRRVRAAADGRVGRSARDSVSGEDACKGVATARSLGDPVRLRPVLERAAGGGRPYLSWERARGPAPPARFLLPRRGPPRVGRPWGERSRGGE